MKSTLSAFNEINWEKFSSSVEEIANIVVVLRSKGMSKPLTELESWLSAEHEGIDKVKIEKAKKSVNYLKNLIKTYNTTSDKKTKFALNQILKRMKII